MERMIESRDIKHMVCVERIKQLEEENKKLNIKVASLEGEIKGLNYTIEKLKEENQYREDIADVLPEGEGHIAEETIQDLQARIKELKETLEHRDSFFSIMRDVLANETITNNEIAMIIYCVVHEECGDYDLSEKELEVVKKFRNREYV